MKFYYPLLAFAIIMSACNQNSSKNEETHIPFKAEKDSRWGLIDWEGNPLIEDEFDEKPSVVTEGHFYVKNSDGLYEFYTAEKKFKKIGGEYVQVGAFHDGLAPVVEKNQPVSFIRPDGTVAFTLDSYKDELVESVSEFREGRAFFKTASGKYGYIDVAGKVVIEPIYDNVTFFENNSARVYKSLDETSGETFIIDKNGKEYFQVNPDYGVYMNFSEHKIGYEESIGDEKGYGFLGEKGEKILKASSKYTDISPFYNGYAVFTNKSEEQGLMDKEGNVVIRSKYVSLKEAGGVLIYRNSWEKFREGIISYEGEVICEDIYNRIIPFKKGNKYTYALDNKEWILIDKKGQDQRRGSFYELDVNSYSFNEYIIESDYVDIQSEVNKVMNLIKEDGSVDKLTYNTKPNEFASIYDKDYKVSDLQDKKQMYQSLKWDRFIHSELNVEYDANVITPNYERKWKESYWGRGHWENEISGYSYNDNAKIKTFVLYLEPTGKLTERKKEVFDAVCRWMETKGYTKLSTDSNNDERISTYWEKKTSVTIKSGIHFYLKNGYISIAIGKE